jgi:hypothetical protein
MILAAVHLTGAGLRAAHNRIHDAPHTAILFSGTDHLIEYNEIFNVLNRTGDGGVVYTGRDWTFRGNVIRFNYLHDLYGMRKWENGIYIDDQASGMTVYGNVLANCHWGMLMGGGRDLRIENNLFLDCTLSIHFDARGLGWAARIRKTLVDRLEAMPYLEAPWSERFPELVPILEDDPMAPKGNVLENNVLVRSGKVEADLAAKVREYGEIGQNIELDDDPGFADRIRKKAPIRMDGIFEKRLPGFESIPFDRIGLFQDAFRKRLPEDR